MFSPPFHSILLIREVGFSLSNLTRKKNNPLSSPNYSYMVILVVAVEID